MTKKKNTYEKMITILDIISILSFVEALIPLGLYQLAEMNILELNTLTKIGNAVIFFIISGITAYVKIKLEVKKDT